MKETYKSISINGLEVLGEEDCSYTANIYNFLYDTNVTNNDSTNFYDGDYSGTSKYASRNFSIVVESKSRNGLRSSFDTRNKMKIKHACGKGDIDIIVEETELGKLCCKAKLESISTDDDSLMTLTFKMANPHIYAYDTKTVELEKQIEGGWIFPTSGFTVPSQWSYNEKVIGNSAEIINEGFITIYPVIEVEGEANNIVITNRTTGESLQLNVQMVTGDRLYVDCNPHTRCVRLNNVSNIDCKSGNYISLVEGSNILEVDYTGDCSVSITYREGY